MSYIVRYMRSDEHPLLEEFLYQAIYVPEGFTGDVPRSIVSDDPKCRAAYEGFGSLPDDRALVADVDGNVVGACWVRTTDEYGHIDDETPSFSISLFKEYRGQGIGTALMERMLDDLRDAGYARASLSVQKENPALRLYKRLGFRIIGDGADETEWLMVIDLARPRQAEGATAIAATDSPILVSACLLGEPCRYDGKSVPCEAVICMSETHALIPLCPEQLGGLPTPRDPSEIQQDGRVIDAAGANRTAEFESGAREALRIAQKHGCKLAILKENSPSCGTHRIYDGSFSGTLVQGKGKAAALLERHGIEVISEMDLDSHHAG